MPVIYFDRRTKTQLVQRSTKMSDKAFAFADVQESSILTIDRFMQDGRMLVRLNSNVCLKL